MQELKQHARSAARPQHMLEELTASKHLAVKASLHIEHTQKIAMISLFVFIMTVLERQGPAVDSEP